MSSSFSVSVERHGWRFRPAWRITITGHGFEFRYDLHGGSSTADAGERARGVAMRMAERSMKMQLLAHRMRISASAGTLWVGELHRIADRLDRLAGEAPTSIEGFDVKHGRLDPALWKAVCAKVDFLSEDAIEGFRKPDGMRMHFEDRDHFMSLDPSEYDGGLVSREHTITALLSGLKSLSESRFLRLRPSFSSMNEIILESRTSGRDPSISTALRARGPALPDLSSNREARRAQRFETTLEKVRGEIIPAIADPEERRMAEARAILIEKKIRAESETKVSTEASMRAEIELHVLEQLAGMKHPTRDELRAQAAILPPPPPEDPFRLVTRRPPAGRGLAVLLDEMKEAQVRASAEAARACLDTLADVQSEQRSTRVWPALEEDDGPSF